MVHLVISLTTASALVRFRIIQTDEYPEKAKSAGVQTTPTLVIPGFPPYVGNLPPAHVVYYLWQAGTSPA